jgi:hypothetical protein
VTSQDQGYDVMNPFSVTSLYPPYTLAVIASEIFKNETGYIELTAAARGEGVKLHPNKIVGTGHRSKYKEKASRCFPCSFSLHLSSKRMRPSLDDNVGLPKIFNTYSWS